MSRISDGQLRWQDPLRPLSESVDGLKINADLTRWFDTNTFYRKPVVTGELELWDSGTFLIKQYSEWDNISSGENNRTISLPGPYTLASLVDDRYYGSKAELIRSFAKVLAKIIRSLKRYRIACVQLNEPSLVYRPGEDIVLRTDDIKATVDAYTRHLSDMPVEIWLHTYFGDASNILPTLLKLPVEAVGIDFIQTPLDSIESSSFKNKLLLCGCVDARNSLLEKPSWIADFSSRVRATLNPKGVVILPNTDLKYLPRDYADKKLKAIGDAAKILKKKEA